jgi:hypothetical protein
MYTLPGILPFLRTSSIHELRLVREVLVKQPSIAVIEGLSGVGKTAAALWLARQLQPDLMPESNSMESDSNALYCALNPSVKTDVALCRALLDVISDHSAINNRSRTFLNRIERIVRERRIDWIVLDNADALEKSSWAVLGWLREMGNLSVALVVRPATTHAWTRSNGSEFWLSVDIWYPFKGLTRDNIEKVVLPNIATSAHIYFDTSADDAQDVVEAIYSYADGCDDIPVSFRRVAYVLQAINTVITQVRQASESIYGDDDTTTKVPLSVSLIHDVAEFLGLGRMEARRYKRFTSAENHVGFSSDATSNENETAQLKASIMRKKRFRTSSI